MTTGTIERLLTAEEFAHMPESRGAELVRGRIVWPGAGPEVKEDPENSWKHASMVARLGAILLDFAIPRRMGQVYSGDPYHGASQVRVLGLPDTLEGHDVLPGFSIRVEHVFDLERSPRYPE